MNDSELHELLTRLPREGASRHFTATVLGRLGRSRRLASIRIAAAVAFVALTALIGVTFGVVESREAHAMAELRTEQERIRTELESLKRLSANWEPVIHLGSDGDVEYVLDLRTANDEPAPPVVRLSNSY
ncbi:MAG TPA: hypothetical protein VMT00_15110 [Thermoanaerobaculia bacterium]|nr:hypothetical protein [Thermoanaerobaculia bacterium]